MSSVDAKSKHEADHTVVSVLESPFQSTSPFSVGESPRRQTLDRSAFNSITAFGFAFAVLNTWCTLVAGIGSGLATGGQSSLFWGFIYAILGNIALTLSLSEVFAFLPTAGGQYHWASVLSKPKWRPAVSWFTAATNTAGWWCGCSSSSYLSTTLYIAAGKAINPDFSPTTGKTYAIYLAIIVIGYLSTLASTARINRYVDSVMMLLSLSGVVILVIVVCSMTKERASAGEVFGGLSNGSGWNSMVIAWLLGLLQSSFSFLGFDVVIHISEEMAEPRKEGPKILLATIVIGGISGIVTLLALLFAIPDVPGILDTAFGLPYTQIVYNATQSQTAAAIMTFIPAILFTFGGKGCQVISARLTMALGRDNGIPAPEAFQRVVGGEPIWGLTVAAIVAALMGLVMLGSSAAFGALLGTAVILLQVSCIIPVILMLKGGRRYLNKVAPIRLYNLGRWGVVVNLLACFFVLESCVIYCFPYVQPVTSSNMNYVIAFVGGFYVLATTMWFTYARKHFQGPKVQDLLALVGEKTGDDMTLDDNGGSLEE